MTGGASDANPEARGSHKHAWKMATHIDGCHFYASSYSCECGATASTYGERNVKDDPYSFVWMEQDEGVTCARCDDLLNGAKPKFEKVITEPGVSSGSSPGVADAKEET